MQTRKDRQVPLPENILEFSVAQGQWSGVKVDVTETRCAGRVLHHLCYENETRLNVLLEEVGHVPCEPRFREHQACPTGYTPRHLYLAPAGMDLWGYCADLRYAKDVTLMFDLVALGQRFDLDLRAGPFTTPRLRFSDDRLWTLVRLLTEAVDSPDPSSQLYGDGLVTAIVARMTSRAEEACTGTKLSSWQLRRVTEYLTANAHKRIELLELASLVGLSQSHFSRGFKATTGRSPYQWQLANRIDRSKVLLLNRHASLESVADATGFADAVHFGRTFRRLVGTTPAAWRRQR